MRCLNPECGKTAKYKSQYIKSNRPYIATQYYHCPHCDAQFTIDKSEGDIFLPDDPKEVLRRVMKDLPILSKDHLKLVYESVRALI